MFEHDELKLLFDNLCLEDPKKISTELSNLLDFSVKENKNFIIEFQERVSNALNYLDRAKKVQATTNAKSKEAGYKNATRQIKGDITKYLQAGRKICYCQTTIHKLVSNCVNCGKVVCEQEGEGPCLFCGAWVDREEYYDVGDHYVQYEKALEHRNKLIDYDINAAKRLGVVDERTDWYELSSNTWLNKDQRQYATHQLEIQKRKEDEIDSKVNIEIDFGKGTITKRKVSDDPDSLFSNMNNKANEFMQENVSYLSRADGQFKPFEAAEKAKKQKSKKEMFEALNSFTFKACDLNDEKSKKLYDGLQLSKKKVKAEASAQFQASSFSQRLQTENPFEEFRLAVENAVIEKSSKPVKVF